MSKYKSAKIEIYALKQRLYHKRKRIRALKSQIEDLKDEIYYMNNPNECS